MDETLDPIGEIDYQDKSNLELRKEILESLLRSANAPDNDIDRMKAITSSTYFMGPTRVAMDVATDLYAAMWELLHNELENITNRLR